MYYREIPPVLGDPPGCRWLYVPRWKEQNASWLGSAGGVVYSDTGWCGLASCIGHDLSSHLIFCNIYV